MNTATVSTSVSRPNTTGSTPTTRTLDLTQPEPTEVIDLTGAADSCLRLLAAHVPLSLLIDLAMPSTGELYDELYDEIQREKIDTSWVHAALRRQP
jgi:hypothetical protein